MKTLNLKYFGVTILIFRVTWRHRNVTIGLGVGTFLLVVNDYHASILHGYGDMGLQKFWGYEFDLLGPRDVIGHVTIKLGIMWFPISGPLEPCVYLALLRRYKASKLHLVMLKAKSSLRMLRVTTCRRSKMTTYLEFLGHIAYLLYNFYYRRMTIRSRL